MNAIDFILSKGLAISRNEARRIIMCGGMRINGQRVITREGDDVSKLELQIVIGDKIRIGRKEMIIES